MTGYLDLPDDRRSLSYIVDWRSRVEVTGAQWQGLVGAIAGLLIGALLRRAWLAIAGGVIGVLAGFTLGFVGGGVIARRLMAAGLGAIIAATIGSALGLFIGLGEDLKRDRARRRLPATVDGHVPPADRGGTPSQA